MLLHEEEPGASKQGEGEHGEGAPLWDTTRVAVGETHMGGEGVEDLEVVEHVDVGDQQSDMCIYIYIRNRLSVELFDSA